MYRVARPLSGDSGFAQRELVCCTIATFKTRTALDTDVAPGVLVLDMQVVPAAAASSAAGKTAAEIPNDLNVPVEVKKQNPFSVVLIRHGAGR